MMQSIELTEYAPRLIDLPAEVADGIYRQYPTQFALDWPSPTTDSKYRLVSKGWVGVFPLRGSVLLNVQPKVPVRNLFAMWEYAYKLDLLRDREALQSSDELPAFFNTLAMVLAKRTMLRARRGLARDYVTRSERLGTVRGRLDVQQMVRDPIGGALPCEYDEHTADVDDNIIVAYTLSRLRRHPALREAVRLEVGRAFHALPSEISMRRVTASDCVARVYSRLNADYGQLHALCRFFLSHTGPLHAVGDASMLPFSVNTADLFEQFVAAWLRVHLPSDFELGVQEYFSVDGPGAAPFYIDLVIRDRATRAVRCVLDTKYKSHTIPRSEDLHQAVSYAEAQACRHAILVYPSLQSREAEYRINTKSVHTVVFDLDGDLNVTGARMLGVILKVISR